MHAADYRLLFAFAPQPPRLTWIVLADDYPLFRREMRQMRASDKLSFHGNAVLQKPL